YCRLFILLLFGIDFQTRFQRILMLKESLMIIQEKFLRYCCSPLSMWFYTSSCFLYRALIRVKRIMRRLETLTKIFACLSIYFLWASLFLSLKPLREGNL